MRKNLFIILAISITLLINFTGDNLEAQTQAQPPPYPKTHRVEQVDTYHGINVDDPYRWLEDLTAKETLNWIKAQDEFATNILRNSERREGFKQQLLTLANYDLYTTPTKIKGRYYFRKTEAGKTQAVVYVQNELTGAAKVLLNPADDFKDQGLNFRNCLVSPDGKLAACTFVQGQSRWQQLKIISAVNKTTTDSLTGLHNLGGNIVWSNDSQGFFYIRFDDIESGAELTARVKNPKIYYHHIRTSQASDELLYAANDRPNTLLSLQLTGDGRYLIITAREGSNLNNRILYCDLKASKNAIVELLKDDASYTFLSNDGKRFFFHTNLQAPRGRIVALDFNTVPQRLISIVPESQEAMAGGSLVGGNAIGMFGNRLAVMYWVDARPVIKIFDLKGRLQHRVNLPEGSSVWGGLNGQANDTEIFYQLLAFTDPSTIYRLELKSGKVFVFKRSELAFKGQDYVIKQVYYRSKDGTPVPMFVAHKKGIALNGNHPTLMYGYGAFGWNSFLFYQPKLLLWLDMGGIYALPRIRGGGEYGEQWHQQGMNLNKQNAIDDFIAAAEWLIKNRYTCAEKLAANGGSASGPMAEAAVIQRPELFGAALIDFPLLDLLRYHKFTGAGQWTEEMGSPENTQEFKVLFSYSPLHNLKKGQCYPPTLIRVGEKDEVTVPLHGYKFAAAMQAAQGCVNPVLIKTVWGSGHVFAGLSSEETTESLADELAFLVRALKVKPETLQGLTVK